jgi:hypothetical protein
MGTWTHPVEEQEMVVWMEGQGGGSPVLLHPCCFVTCQLVVCTIEQGCVGGLT